MKNIKLFENFKDDYLTILKDEFINFIDKDILTIDYNDQYDTYDLCFTTNCIDKTSLEIAKTAESIIKEYQRIDKHIHNFELEYPKFRRCHFSIDDNNPPWANVEISYKVTDEEVKYKNLTILNKKTILLEKSKLYEIIGLHPNTGAQPEFISSFFNTGSLLKIYTSLNSLIFVFNSINTSEMRNISIKLIQNLKINNDIIFDIEDFNYINSSNFNKKNFSLKPKADYKLLLL